jgi:cbb3-type cytochrome oxidase subunit 3
MKQAALSQFDMPWLPISGLLIFAGCFIAYTYWTYKKENKELYDHAAMIPFSEGKK